LAPTYTTEVFSFAAGMPSLKNTVKPVLSRILAGSGRKRIHAEKVYVKQGITRNFPEFRGTI
jgi:hypothetical protein